ncbi:hypothetical protein predicted by Glimmer/Critica [Acetobacter senegalensis]|uniref:Uncharacterized protein n=2 Tax=Acetobacter TaxID=434 RepID=A0A0U5B781_9PROT|nr:hypothetical protein ATPR_3332 [Acetobacter tropicalis NBRC 101654]CEF40389.1 hypothetical protein predicted by Glimmer/Critica [Acetobacter senegalensis]
MLPTKRAPRDNRLWDKFAAVIRKIWLKKLDQVGREKH